MEEYYLLIGFAVSILDIIVGILFYMVLFQDWDVCIPMPNDFEYETEMNWFGSIVCYILLFILFPILNIGKVIYWLFHI